MVDDFFMVHLHSPKFVAQTGYNVKKILPDKEKKVGVRTV